MARILLVQNDPAFCEAVAGDLKASSADVLDYALTGTSAAKMLVDHRFEVALINATLPDRSGIELATLAANQDTPVLMLSEDPRISEELQRLHYQYVEKPFTFDTLMSASKLVMLDRKENIRRTKLAVAKMDANLEALKAEIAESHRLFDAIVARLGYWRT